MSAPLLRAALGAALAGACAAEPDATKPVPPDAGADARDDLSRPGDAARDAPPERGVAEDTAPDRGCLGVLCAGLCCRARERCGHGQCLPDLGRCAAGADGGAPPCPSDAWCDADGFCTPYGVPASMRLDPSCRTRAVPAPLVPARQCAWTMSGINGTPVVAPLGRGAPDAPRVPSVIVAVNDVPGSPYTSGGRLRIFNSRTCEVEVTFGETGQVVASAGTAAVGDLDGDGLAEIVAGSGTGGVIAFHQDRSTGRWGTLWRAAGPTYTGPAPALADLTGDGSPEVLLGMHVWDALGRPLVAMPETVTYQGYQQPTFLADVDLDGTPELVANGAVWSLDVPGRRWVRAPFDRGAPSEGFEALADFGEFPGRAGDAPGRPEIVQFNTTRLSVRTVGGDVVFSAPGALVGGGGPPAVADLDGDGRPEIVVAGRALVAFDPDCVPGGGARGGRCASMRTDGVLWVQSGLRDASSAINGVTVFDFDGDGRVEVVEADECFTRIFDGTTGLPRWSAPRVSCTFIEMPVVADVDGDLSAEIVVGANRFCGAECGLERGAPDPILPGFACASDAACPPGARCAGGLCRCAMDGDCGAGNACTEPLRPDPLGRVCRSTFDPDPGLRIYGDARNRWVPSRPVWSQYAYSITHVGDDGVVPPRATARNNWREPGLNNFRQNTQRGLGDLQAPNLTIGPSPRGCLPVTGAGVRLQARFCNRGTGVAGAHSAVSFFAVARDGARTPLCTAMAPRPLEPGACVDVSCDGPRALDPQSAVEAQADANDQVQECREDDNRRELYRPEDCIG